MANTERTYTIPLREDFIKVPAYRRAKRAVSNIKKFISRHMKTEDVRLGKFLNEAVWANGIKNPPGKVKVKAVKTDDYVTVELEGHEYKADKTTLQKKAPETLKEKLESKMDSGTKKKTATKEDKVKESDSDKSDDSKKEPDASSDKEPSKKENEAEKK